MTESQVHLVELGAATYFKLPADAESRSTRDKLGLEILNQDIERPTFRIRLMKSTQPKWGSIVLQTTQFLHV
jgi:hypothetical protein